MGTKRTVFVDEEAKRKYDPDSDRYRLIRSMPGSNDWLLDDLDRLRRELLGERNS